MLLSFDRLIDDVVGDGKYQLVIVAIVITQSLGGAYLNTGAVFLAALPDSRCRIEPFDSNWTLFPNLTSDKLEETFIPWNLVTQENDRCHMNVYDNQNATDKALVFPNSSVVKKVPCQDGYVYDHSVFDQTIVTEWDLVCDQAHLGALSTSLYYVGIFFGSLLGGILSDRYGRMLIFRISCCCTIIVSSAIAFSPNLYVFMVLRFLLAAVYFQSTAAGYTYVAEISKTTWRTNVGMLFNANFGAGCMLLSGLAYVWRDWRHLQVAVGVIGFGPLFLLSWFFPKSPRWLYGKNKIVEAKAVLKKIAKQNGGTFPEQLWNELENTAAPSIQKLQKIESANGITKKEERSSKENSFANFFRKPYTRYMICSNMFVWMITCLVYYGLVLIGGSLPGNIFVNNAIGGLMELIACTVAIPCIRWKGFTVTTSASLYFASASCLVSTLLAQLGQDDVTRALATILAMCGRFGVSLTFGTIYLHTVELFPTVGRSTALGLSSMAARIGSIFSPFTAQMQYDIPWLTPVIYGITASIAGLFASSFPDTRKAEFSTTFDEAEQFFSEHLRNSIASKVCCVPKSKLSTIDDEEDAETLISQKSLSDGKE